MSDKIDLAEFETAAGTYALADMDITPLILLARAVRTMLSVDTDNTVLGAAAMMGVMIAAESFIDSAEVRHGQG